AESGKQGALLLAARRMEAQCVLSLEGIHLAAKAWWGVPVRMAGSVAERNHCPACDVAGLVQVAVQRRDGPATRRGHFGFLEGRLQGDLQEGIECPLGELCRHRQREGA